MKKILSILMISLLAGAMLLTACKKDETNNNNSETPGGGTETQPTGTIENNVVTDIDGNVYNAMFWCATSGGEEIAWSRSIGYTYYHIGSSAGDYKGNGYSVRCVRD